jgi:hypothetical protein
MQLDQVTIRDEMVRTDLLSVEIVYLQVIFPGNRTAEFSVDS